MPRCINISNQKGESSLSRIFAMDYMFPSTCKYFSSIQPRFSFFLKKNEKNEEKKLKWRAREIT